MYIILCLFLDSRYLAKGFYDLNMTIDEIKQFYDSTTDPSFS